MVSHNKREKRELKDESNRALKWFMPKLPRGGEKISAEEFKGLSKEWQSLFSLKARNIAGMKMRAILKK